MCSCKCKFKLYGSMASFEQTKTTCSLTSRKTLMELFKLSKEKQIAWRNNFKQDCNLFFFLQNA